MKDAQQVRDLQDPEDKRRYLAKLEIASRRTPHTEQANQCSESTAVHVGNLGKLEDYVRRELCESFQLALKKASLVAADDATAASNDNDPSLMAAFQSQVHGPRSLR